MQSSLILWTPSGRARKGRCSHPRGSALHSVKVSAKSLDYDNNNLDSLVGELGGGVLDLRAELVVESHEEDVLQAPVAACPCVCCVSCVTLVCANRPLQEEAIVQNVSISWMWPLCLAGLALAAQVRSCMLSPEP